MREDDILVGSLMEDSWMTLEQLAAACTADAAWLLSHVEEGLLPQAHSMAGVWRFSDKLLLRARRIRQLERDFDAVPELAALVADMLDEMDRMRARLACAGLE